MSLSHRHRFAAPRAPASHESSGRAFAGLVLHRSIPKAPCVELDWKTAGAGFAGSLTLLSLADRDLFFRRLPCRGGDRGPNPGRSHPADVGCNLRGFVRG